MSSVAERFWADQCRSFEKDMELTKTCKLCEDERPVSDFSYQKAVCKGCRASVYRNRVRSR